MSLERIGEILKKQRIQKGISLEEIARETQINIDQLKAIENAESSKLPAKVYMKGFIQAYGRVIQFDVQPLLDIVGSVQEDPVLKITQPKNVDEGLRTHINLAHFILSAGIVFFVGIIVFMRSLLNQYEVKQKNQPGIQISKEKSDSPQTAPPTILPTAPPAPRPPQPKEDILEPINEDSSSALLDAELMKNPVYFKKMKERIEKHLPKNFEILPPLEVPDLTQEAGQDPVEIEERILENMERQSQ